MRPFFLRALLTKPKPARCQTPAPLRGPGRVTSHPGRDFASDLSLTSSHVRLGGLDHCDSVASAVRAIAPAVADRTH